LIPAAKNPVKYLSMYPNGVQKAVRGLPQYQNLPSAKSSKMSATVIQGLAFIIVIDWLLFCQKKQFRIAGTEHMDKEYKNYFYHFKVFLKGIVLGLVVSFIVAIIIYLI